ncbi:MAG: N-acetylmuramoyl-L-alanine amidase [Oscillospiraceae bacterium]|nr:N-acetylmuramoyl-L-alanine amidase [Oscillospiraceae bacterium]
MLNKRFKTLAGLLCVILGAAILAVPVLSRGRYESAPVFSAMGHDDPVIIDPGHGGEDGGAVSPDGVYESDINLDVSLKLEQLMAFTGVRPVMTRSSRDIDYPDDADTIRKKKVYDQKTRVELINSLPGGVLISVHQNKYTDSGPSGAQVLFAATEGSGRLASVMESALAETIGTENVRSAKQISPDIFLMKNVSCPAVLIECGFLSNPGDRAMLVTDGYQLKLACGIVCGYLRFIAEGT